MAVHRVAQALVKIIAPLGPSRSSRTSEMSKMWPKSSSSLRDSSRSRNVNRTIARIKIASDSHADARTSLRKLYLRELVAGKLRKGKWEIAAARIQLDEMKLRHPRARFFRGPPLVREDLKTGRKRIAVFISSDVPLRRLRVRTRSVDRTQDKRTRCP